MTTPDPNTPQPLTPAEVERMAEIESKATKGEWSKHVNKTSVCVYSDKKSADGRITTVCQFPYISPSARSRVHNNGDFIAHSRAFVPHAITTMRQQAQTIRDRDNKLAEYERLLREALPYIVAEGSGIDRRIRKAVGE